MMPPSREARLFGERVEFPSLESTMKLAKIFMSSQGSRSVRVGRVESAPACSSPSERHPSSLQQPELSSNSREAERPEPHADRRAIGAHDSSLASALTGVSPGETARRRTRERGLDAAGLGTVVGGADPISLIWGQFECREHNGRRGESPLVCAAGRIPGTLYGEACQNLHAKTPNR